MDIPYQSLRASFLLLLLSLTQIDAVANTDFLVKKIAVTEGLSNGRVNNIATDSLGYVWLATANGLTRYSGSNFKKYNVQLQDTFSDPSVLKLLQHKGKLYALFQGGAIYEYNYQQDQWFSIFELSGERFLSFGIFSDTKFIIGTTQGIFLYDVKSGQTSERLLPDLLYIRKVLKAEDRIFISSSKGLLIASVSDNDKIEVQQKILPDHDILDFERDGNQVLWIGTDGDGLFRYQNGETKSIDFLEKKEITVRDISLKKDGSVLVALDRWGLYILDMFGNVVSSIAHDPDDENTISQNSINTIYCDEDGVVWLGIGEIGLNLLYERTSQFERIVRSSDDDNSIENNIIRAIHQDDKENIWFGTEQGLSKRSKDGSWTNYSRLGNYNSVPILTITSYQGDLLLGTYGEGLLRLNPKTSIFSKFNSEIKLKRVYSLFQTDSNLWVGGIDGPVYRIVEDSIVGSYVAGQAKTFAWKNKHQLIVGSVEGVYIIDIKTNELRKYTRNSWPLGNIYSLYYDSEKDFLWVGNDNGLIKLNYNTGEAFPINDFSSASGAVYSIIHQGNGELWIGAEKGLFKYSTGDTWYRSYTTEDGQFTNEFGFGARSKLLDQRLAFGGPNGAVILDPKWIFKDKKEPKIHFSNFLINGSAHESESLTNLNYIDQLALDYNENTLEFDIDFIKFHGNKDFRLQWQLEGWDKEVNQRDNKSAIIYRNLPPGNFTLRASVLNADGVRSSNSLIKVISIKNPYWLQWWAFVLYVGFLALFIYILIVINRARQERKLNDEKIKFFIDVAHDIRTPVSLIRLASDQLLKNDNIEDSVQIIKRYTSNLNEYVTELLDFQKSERNMLRVFVSEFDIIALLHQTIDDFKPLSDQKSLAVELNLPEGKMIWGDKAQLGRVFTNLISNAIKYNHERGLFAISMSEDSGTVVVKFRDTGFGIPKGQIDKIFTRFHRADNAFEQNIRGTGIGLMLSKRIAELHKGFLTVESEENVGSTFMLKLLKGRSHFNPSDIKTSESASRINRITETNIKSRKSILVIEDNEDILRYIEKSLSEDYFVVTANDGKDGLYQLFEMLPDLVITDVMLPGMNGKEICHVVKNDKKTSSIPVMILTALTGMDDKIAGLEVGADYYLEKPFDIEVLRLAVKNLLKRSQLDKEINEKSQKSIVKNPEESFLSNIIDIINANMTNQEFSIDDLCDEVGLSRSNLFRKMKSISGMSPSDLIQEIKLNKAKQLLKDDPNVRIDDVAYKCGFNDPKYFSTLFKKHFKKTPSEFQATYKV